jgi:hypothetical protein
VAQCCAMRSVGIAAIKARHRINLDTVCLSSQYKRGSSDLSSTPPGHSTFGLRSSCERAEPMLALVMRVTPISTLADTCSPFEAASAVLTPS